MCGNCGNPNGAVVHGSGAQFGALDEVRAVHVDAAQWKPPDAAYPVAHVTEQSEFEGVDALEQPAPVISTPLAGTPSVITGLPEQGPGRQAGEPMVCHDCATHR